MLDKEIVELFNQNEFEEIEKLLSKLTENEIKETFSKLEKSFVLHLFPKLSPEIASEIFLTLDKQYQLEIIHGVSYVKFKHIANELLESDAENILSPEVFNEIILKAKAENRNEKLIEIIDKLENKQFASLKPLLAELEPIDIAEIFNECDYEKVSKLFRLLPKDLASDVFVEMDSDSQEMLIKSFTDKELEFIINDLFLDDTVDIIEEMPANVVTRILQISSAENREVINKLLKYPKDSAGSIMTTEYITVKENNTVHEALKKIRQQATNKETIYTCYVTDDKRHLIGIVSAKDLIIHEPTDIIGTFMDKNVISATTRTDKEEVSNMLSKYDMLTIPIVDDENRINGIVTIDDAIDVIQEEATEDISKMHGVTPTKKPYLQTSVLSIVKARLPWLLVLLVSATFTGLIINKFEGVLQGMANGLLFACVPMLMDSGGNAGSQSSTTIICSLALDEIHPRDVFKIIWKEVRAAIILAAVLAVACFTKLQLIDRLIFGYQYTMTVSVVVSFALFCTIVIAKIVGSSFPLLIKKMKLDPASVVGPFITTIVDAISLLIYCGIAIALLG